VRFRKLGATGLDVSTVALGTAMFGFPHIGCDEEAARGIFAVYRDAGGNFVDTADFYGTGASEEITGRLLEDCREEFVLATKVGQVMGEGPNRSGLSRKHILRAVDDSLRRLQTDYIDLYQIHSVDPHTPMDETLETLDLLVRSGKVRYIGCSNIEAWRLADTMAVARERDLAAFASAQLRYSLLSREIEREHLAACEAHGLGVIVFNPLAAGVLTGKALGGAAPEGSRISLTDRYASWMTDEKVAVTRRVVEIAERLGAAPAQVALAWALGRPGITSVINGASRAEQMAQNVAAADLELPAADQADLDERSRERLGYPYEFMLEIEETAMRPPGCEDAGWPAAWRGQTWG